MGAEVAAIGRALPRIEDRRHLTGAATFVDDLHRRDLRHLAFVRSPHAAARIAAIDVAAAGAADDVDAVVTAADLEHLAPLVPVLDRPDFVPIPIPLLATDRVRYAGEPIAMVVAASPHAAEDAAAEVRVEYEPLAPVVEIETALAEGAPRLHDQVEANTLIDVLFRDDPEVESVLGAAHLVVEATIRSSRVSAVPMEGRACLAEWTARDGRLTLHTSTQVPHIVRTALATVFGLAEQRVRVVAPDVGGGFGQKNVVAPEEALTCAAARIAGAPVRWTEDRQENLLAGFQGHEQRFRLRGGYDADGRLRGLDADIVSNVGAYSTYPFTCAIEPLMAASELPGPYTLRHYRARARGVATNKPPTAPYRGVARPQLVLAMERLMQKAAHRLGIDQVEIRRRNLVADCELPYETVTGIVLDEASYREALERCAAGVGYQRFGRRQEAARAEGRLLGIGFSVFAERTGYGTRAFRQRQLSMVPGYDIADVRMDPSGEVTVIVGTSGHGQGHETTLAQVAADVLALDPNRVVVRQGDTDALPYGWGTFASRSIVVSGGATTRAAAELADKLRRIGAHLLEAALEDVELRDGEVAVRGSPGRSVAVAEIAQVAYLHAHRLPGGEQPGLLARATFDPPGTVANAAHACIVEVHPGTGEVRIHRYHVVEDCGTLINPAVVEGQVRGGVTQGIAAALYEAIDHDEDGQSRTTTFMDYLVPTAMEVPEIEIDHIETPSRFSETGAKGVGEGGTMGAPACVATAVADALAHLGVEVDSIPIAPESIAAALERAVASAVS